MAGLLDFLDTEDGRLGLGLLAAAGPSMTPMSFGQRLAGAMQGYRAERTAAEERALKKAQADAAMTQFQWSKEDRDRAQAQQAQMVQTLMQMDPSGKLLTMYRMDPKATVDRVFPKPIGISDVSPKDYTPESWRTFDANGRSDPSVLIPRPKMTNVNGVAVDVEGAKPGTVLPQDPNAQIQRGPNGEPVLNPTAVNLHNANQPFSVGANGNLIPNGPVQQFMLNRAAAGAAQVSMGTPFQAVGSNGQPEFFQPGNRPGVPPQAIGLRPPEEKLKPIPPTQLDAIQSNRATIAKIDEAIRNLEDRPASVGATNYLPDALTQRLDPKGVSVRAALADIAGQKFHDLSGAAVSVGEAARLKPFIPAVTDDPKTARTKLEQLRSQYASTLDQQVSAYGKDQGYKPVPEWKPPSKQFNVNGKGIIGRLDPKDGKYYVTRDGKKYEIQED